MKDENREIANGDEFEITIEELGGLGDGLAHHGGRPVYVPYTLDGDRVLARARQVNSKRVRAELKEVLEGGPDRTEAPCKHFALCGGCDLQHLKAERYATFKRETMRHAVSRAGFDADVVEDAVIIGPTSRRRAEFKVKLAGERNVIGFFERRSHRVVDLEMCPVLDPALEKLIEPMRGLIALFNPLSEVETIALTKADVGIDMTISAKGRTGFKDRAFIEQFAEEHDVARISWSNRYGTQMLLSRAPVEMQFGGMTVSIPSSAFLQATSKGERAIAEIIIEATANETSVLDLYSGCGAWTLPLLKAGHAVTAYEGDADMVNALQAAFDANGLISRAKVEQRDLYHEPVRGEELLPFAAAVVNPPRTGGEPQIEALAAAEVPLIVVVSCNPLALERDARHLSGKDYRLERAVPVDQFHWSTHLESVAVFRRSPHIA